MLLKRVSVTSEGRGNLQPRSSRNTHKEVHIHDPVDYQFIKQKPSVKNQENRNTPQFNNCDGILFCFKYLGDFCKKTWKRSILEA